MMALWAGLQLTMATAAAVETGAPVREVLPHVEVVMARHLFDEQSLSGMLEMLDEAIASWREVN